jgi:hypothetical protein
MLLSKLFRGQVESTLAQSAMLFCFGQIVHRLDVASSPGKISDAWRDTGLDQPARWLRTHVSVMERV